MRDDSQRWDAPRALTASIAVSGLTVTPVPFNRQTLISGIDVRAGLAVPLIEWPDIARTKSYALSLRRDRILVIDGPALPDGWDDTTQRAISDVSDGYQAFDIQGDRAMDLLKRGTEISLQSPSKSVARLLFGLGVLLYRVETANRFRLHVASAQSEAMWKTLKDIARAIE